MNSSTRSSRTQAAQEQAAPKSAHGWAAMSLGERIVLAARAAVAARLAQSVEQCSQESTSDGTSEFRRRIAIGGAGPRWIDEQRAAESPEPSGKQPSARQVTDDLSGSPDAPPGLAGLVGPAIALDLITPDPTFTSAPARPCTAARAAFSPSYPPLTSSAEPREGAD
jgi:hypothetical protein